MAAVSYQYKVVTAEFTMAAGEGDQSDPALTFFGGSLWLVYLYPYNGPSQFYGASYALDGSPTGGTSQAYAGVCSDAAITVLSNGFLKTVGVSTQASGSAGGTSVIQGGGIPSEASILGNAILDQTAPDVAGLTGDRWVAVWTHQVVEPLPSGPVVRSDIHMSVLNNAGTTVVKNDVGVVENAGNQRNASVAALSSGGFVVTYVDELLAGPGNQPIVAQRYDSDGNKLGSLIAVDFAGDHGETDIVGLDNGGFAIAYSDTETGAFGISLRIFDASGVAVGNRINVSTGTGNSDPTIARMSNGALTTSWTHKVSESNNDLYMRSFSADGAALTNPFRFQGTDVDAFNERDADIAAGRNGQIALAWTDHQVTDAGGTHIGGAVYALERQTFGDATSETLVGDSLDDFMNGFGGNDFLHANAYGADGLMKPGAGDAVLYGDLGNDGLFGGDGNDNLYGGADNDGVVGGAGNDFLRGGSGVDFVFGGAFGAGGARLPGSGNDRLFGDEGNDGLYGFDGEDEIDGGDNNDYVEGGAGGDTINGGAGSDYLLGQEGADIVNGGTGFDYMYGGAGADTFIFRKSDSADWILDFKAGEGDKIRLPDFGFANFAAIPLVDLSTPGNPAVQFTFIQGGNVDQLTIFGVTLAQLNATNVLVN